MPTYESNQADHESRMWSIAKQVFADSIPAHQLRCLEPGGAVYEMAERMEKQNKEMGQRMDKQSKTLNYLIGALIFVSALAPIALGIWNGYKSDSNNKMADMRLEKQVQIAADVARQLKEVGDAARPVPSKSLGTERREPLF